MMYGLAAADDSQSSNPEAEAIADLAERLHYVFTKLWKDTAPTEVPDINTVIPLLKDVPPPTPSVWQVKATLEHLNPKKATGVDKILAWLLKRFCKELVPVVNDIVCASIVQCKCLELYKHALISSVSKVYFPNDIDNDFRQISVLPQLDKVLEKLQLTLNRQDLKISYNQHAFTKGRSTVSVLACISLKWFNMTENSPDGRMGVHALFLDFQKAFDMVDHGILKGKLGEFNINQSFWLWIQSFLDGRSQQVKLRGTLSSLIPCPAGVAQGSVISPTLFNVHINNPEDPDSLIVDT